MFTSGQGGMFAFHVLQGDISDSDTTPQRSPKPFVPPQYEILMANQAERVADRLLRAANQVDDLETLIQGQGMNPLPFEAYTKIREDYLDNIERTISGTARGDPSTLAEVQMLDLTMQDQILTENSSWDLLVAAGMVDMSPTPTPAPPAPELHEPSFDIIPTPMPAEDSSKCQDSSDFELYGAEESESSEDEDEEGHKDLRDIFGSSSDDDHERWWAESIGAITPSYSPHGYSPQTVPGTPEVTSSVSEYNSEEEED
jgi:hypothetical protein